jgi:hypothetical protein
MLDLSADAREAEIKELEVVAEALARTPRLATLLRYMGEKYFNGAAEELTEYNIATDVCGRSRSTFVAGEDAIARVEVHRLRKRLREYYANEGQSHAVHISIPPGRYVPTFNRTTNGEAAQAEMPAVPATPTMGMANAVPKAAPAETPEPAAIPPSRSRWGWLYPSVVLALLIVGLAIAGSLRLRMRHNAIQRSGSSTADHESSPLPAPGSEGIVRIIAGYTGQPIRDISGDFWNSDRFFHGGATWPNSERHIGRTNDPLLFSSWRSGDFSYDVPLKPGVYELHLYFVSPASPDTDADRATTFNISANGRPLLLAFDVNSDALGDSIADERVFRDISPAPDGILHLSFAHALGVPALNALEIIPGTPHRQLPVRIAMQRTAFIDHDGNTWIPDNYYLNGTLSGVHQPVTGTADPELFGSERFGHFTYSIPVDTRDRYTLVLHFAEFYFGSGSAGGGVGSRVFNVFCNGTTLLGNFDVYKEAGSLHLLTKSFEHVKPSAQGKLNLTFEPVVNNATISGIEVLDESR